MVAELYLGYELGQRHNVQSIFGRGFGILPKRIPSHQWANIAATGKNSLGRYDTFNIIPSYVLKFLGRLVETLGVDPYLNGISFGLACKAFSTVGIIPGGKVRPKTLHFYNGSDF